jgi:sigma-B regulation protein RsbU (phosphoserine phosphatase)
VPPPANVRLPMSDAPTVPPAPALPASALPASAEALDSALLRVLMETSADRIYFKDLRSRFVRNSDTHARSLGAASPADCVGKSDYDFFAHDHAENAFRAEQEIIRTGIPIVAKTERITRRDGTHGWVSTTKMPWRDASGRTIGTFGVTRDVTAAHEAEAELLEERNRLRTIIDHLPSRLYVKDTASRYVLNNKAHLAMLGAPSQESALGRTTVDFFPGERGLQALADDRQVLGGGAPLVNVEKSDFGPEGDVHWSLVTKVPLHDTQAQLVGLVGISHDITRRKKAELELQRRTTEMETDLRMARQVQEAFLNRAYPFFPRTASAESSALRFAHRYIPTSTLGGDFFDVLQLSDSRCGVLVCDVMGHGVRAGLLTALIRGVVEEVGAHSGDPTQVVAEINRSLMPIVEQTGQPIFATVFFGLIDLDARTLVYANAGHPPPLVRSASGDAVLRLAPADPEPAAGLIADFPYSRLSCEFAPGALLLGYTDGVLEAADTSGQMFGEARLRALVGASRGQTCAELQSALIAAVQAHSGHADFDDDVCLVAVESRECSDIPKS